MKSFVCTFQALLPNLINLESRVIRDREAATLQYQGDVFRAEGNL